ncbi:hypothetical protein DFH06DRAFT_1189546 [Mycena polygramma]|nr:hypothetical protein DFH06DRAFT_1189546 [Mycena polygramma]
MQSRPSYADKLAPEVWSNCWSYANKSQLKRLCLVCRYFHTVCQPLLFRAQSIAVPFVAPENWMATTQRLHYADYRLTKIAATAHALAVRTWDWSGSEDMEELSHLFPLITHIYILQNVWRRLVATFTSTLGSFQRLTVLRLLYLEIGPELRATLATLPVLQDLTLTRCVILTRTGALLPLRRFSFCGRFGSLSSETPIELVDPGKLETLFIRGSPTIPADDIAILSALSVQPFLRLVELRVILAPHHAALLFRLLDRCSALQSLNLLLLDMDEWRESLPQQLPDTTVPLLESFVGSPTLVRLFVHNRPVVDVVESAWGELLAESDPLALTLLFLQDSSCGSVPLQRLTVTEALRATQMPKVFTAITSFLPELREVRISLRDIPPDSVQNVHQAHGVNAVQIDTEEEDEQVDDRMVELRDGSVEYARSEEDLEMDFVVAGGSINLTHYQDPTELSAIPAPAPALYLPGYMYVDFDPRVPVFGELPVAGALTDIMDLISRNEIPLPPHLEILCFVYRRRSKSMLPLELAHQATLALEQLCPALQKIQFDHQYSWVRARHMWTRLTHFYTWTNGTAEPIERVQIVSQVWNADGTRRQDEAVGGL